MGLLISDPVGEVTAWAHSPIATISGKNIAHAGALLLRWRPAVCAPRIPHLSTVMRGSYAYSGGVVVGVTPAHHGECILHGRAQAQFLGFGFPPAT